MARFCKNFFEKNRFYHFIGAGSKTISSRLELTIVDLRNYLPVI